jgi:hypothetical protein
MQPCLRTAACYFVISLFCVNKASKRACVENVCISKVVFVDGWPPSKHSYIHTTGRKEAARSTSNIASVVKGNDMQDRGSGGWRRVRVR